MKRIKVLFFVGALLVSLIGSYSHNTKSTSSNLVDNVTTREERVFDDEVKINKIVDYYSSGDGTEANPFILSSAEGLVIFSSGVNGGTIATDGKYFKINPALTSVTLNNWVSIGTYDHPFIGNFDGSDCKITYSINITTKTELQSFESGSIVCLGFFGKTGKEVDGPEGNKSASIKNLIISNPYIAIDGADDVIIYRDAEHPSIYSGFLCGNAEYSTFTKCKVTALSNQQYSFKYNKVENSFGTSDLSVGGMIGRFQGLNNNSMESLEVKNLGFFISGYNSRLNCYLGGLVGSLDLYNKVSNISVINSKFNLDSSSSNLLRIYDIYYGDLCGSGNFSGASVQNSSFVNNSIIANYLYKCSDLDSSSINYVYLGSLVGFFNGSGLDIIRNFIDQSKISVEFASACGNLCISSLIGTTATGY